MKSTEYLDLIGTAHLPPRTTPFDPGYDSETFKAHLRQSGHLMAGMKISMACWQIAAEDVTREKISACRAAGISTSAGGGPLEVAAHFDRVPEYLELCSDIGFDCIEAGEGFIRNDLNPLELVSMARDQGLDVQFELGEKHAGAFDGDVVSNLLRQGQRWLDAGAKRLVIEARESAVGVGLFDENGTLNVTLASRFVTEFGVDQTVFEAPIKRSQFALINALGANVRLGNIRLEDVLRVEIYRRGLHSDAFAQEHLRPRGNVEQTAARNCR